MLPKSYLVFKWLVYASATLLFFALQSLVLNHIRVLGLTPFLYPLLAAIPATWESPSSGTIFSLSMGVVCDLLLPGPIPCFYTLVFPLAGLFSSLLAQGLLQAGFLCSLVSAAGAFCLTDGFHCFLLWLNGRPAWETGAFLALREFCVTAPFIIPVTFLFRAVFCRTHAEN